MIKRLPAEVLLDAYSQVTQVPEKFEGYPVGMRGMQLPDTAVKSYFLTAFGRPVRQQTRESERTSVPTITQALHIINGDTLNNKLRAPGSSIDMLLKLGFSDEQIVDYLYLASLSRPPNECGAVGAGGRARIGRTTEDCGCRGSSPCGSDRYVVVAVNERRVYVQSLIRIHKWCLVDVDLLTDVCRVNEGSFDSLSKPSGSLWSA